MYSLCPKNIATFNHSKSNDQQYFYSNSFLNWKGLNIIIVSLKILARTVVGLICYNNELTIELDSREAAIIHWGIPS
jgi:hypothetical protein